METYKTHIISLAEKLIPGTLVKTPLGKSKLIKKYPYLAHCENGCWAWNEIYLAENGILLEDRQAEISRKMKEVKEFYE